MPNSSHSQTVSREMIISKALTFVVGALLTSFAASAPVSSNVSFVDAPNASELLALNALFDKSAAACFINTAPTAAIYNLAGVISDFCKSSNGQVVSPNGQHSLSGLLPDAVFTISISNSLQSDYTIKSGNCKSNFKGVVKACEDGDAFGGGYYPDLQATFWIFISSPSAKRDVQHVNATVEASATPLSLVSNVGIEDNPATIDQVACIGYGGQLQLDNLVDGITTFCNTANGQLIAPTGATMVGWLVSNGMWQMRIESAQNTNYAVDGAFCLKKMKKIIKNCARAGPDMYGGYVREKGATFYLVHDFSFAVPRDIEVQATTGTTPTLLASRDDPATGNGGASPRDMVERKFHDPNLVCTNEDAPGIAWGDSDYYINEFCLSFDGKIAQPGLYPLADIYFDYNNDNVLALSNVSLSIDNNGPTEYKVKVDDCVSGMNYIMDHCLGTGGIWYQEKLKIYWLIDINHASTPYPGQANAKTATAKSMTPVKRNAHVDFDPNPPHDIPLDGLHSFVSCYEGNYATVDDGPVSNAIYNFCQTYAGSTPLPGTLGIVDVKNVGDNDIVELVCQKGSPDSTYTLNPPDCAAALGHIYNSCPSKLGGVYYSSDPMYDVFYSLMINQPSSQGMHSTIPNPSAAPSPLPPRSLASSDDSAAEAMRELVSSDAVKLSRRGKGDNGPYATGTLWCYNGGAGAGQGDTNLAVLTFCKQFTPTTVKHGTFVTQTYILVGDSAGILVTLAIHSVHQTDFFVSHATCLAVIDWILGDCLTAGGIYTIEDVAVNFILDINPTSQAAGQAAAAGVDHASIANQAVTGSIPIRDLSARLEPGTLFCYNSGSGADRNDVGAAITKFCHDYSDTLIPPAGQVFQEYQLGGVSVGKNIIMGIDLVTEANPYRIFTDLCKLNFDYILDHCGGDTTAKTGGIYTMSSGGNIIMDINPASQKQKREAVSDITTSTSSALAHRDTGDQISCNFDHTAPFVDVDTAMLQYCRLNANVRLAQGQQANQAFSLPNGGKVIFGTATTDQYGYEIETDWCVSDYTNLLNYCSDGRLAKTAGGINVFGSDGVRIMVDILPPPKKLARREQQSTGLECRANQPGFGENKTAVAEKFQDFCKVANGFVVPPGGRKIDACELSGRGHWAAIAVENTNTTHSYTIQQDLCVEMYTLLLGLCSGSSDVAIGGTFTDDSVGVDYVLAINPHHLDAASSLSDSKQIARRDPPVSTLFCRFNQLGFTEYMTTVKAQYNNFCESKNLNQIPDGGVAAETYIPDGRPNSRISVAILMLMPSEGYVIQESVCKDSFEALVMDCSAGIGTDDAVGGTVTSEGYGVQYLVTINGDHLMPADYEPFTHSNGKS